MRKDGRREEGKNRRIMESRTTSPMGWWSSPLESKRGIFLTFCQKNPEDEGEEEANQQRRVKTAKSPKGAGPGSNCRVLLRLPAQQLLCLRLPAFLLHDYAPSAGSAPPPRNWWPRRVQIFKIYVPPDLHPAYGDDEE